MSPLVNVTPSTDGEAALSQIATAKLRFGLDVAFCGGHPDYWAALRFYDWLGLMDDPVVRADLSRMRDEAISDSLAHGTVLDRASAALEDSPLVTERPGGPAGVRERRPRAEGPGGGA